MVLPYQIGTYIEITQKRQNNSMTDSEFDKQVDRLKLMLAIAGAVSLVARFIYHNLFFVIASKI